MTKMSVGTAWTFIVANWDVIKDIVILLVAVWGMTSSSARGAIAAVFEILKDSQGMSSEQALQKASDLMGKKFPYIPEALRKLIIQWCFDSMKKAVSPEKK